MKSPRASATEGIVLSKMQWMVEPAGYPERDDMKKDD